MCRKLIYLTCLVLILGVAGNASAQILVHYKLDETSGAVASDSSGKGNDGTIVGDPNWVAGWMDGALQFDGSLSVTLPASTMGLRSDTGSVAFWMNMAELTGNINTIWWGGDNTTGGGMGPENEMHIHIESPVANIWTGGELCFRVLHGPLVHLHCDPEKGDASVPGDPPVNPILMNDGEWHHVVSTWGDADGNVNLYLDGNLLQQATYTTPSYPLTNIYLGRMADGGRTYTGLLDDVQIYGGALTADEIQIVMSGGEILSLKAALPEPANQATEVPRDAVLSWMAGDRANKHNVYFGTVFDDVNEAGITDPRGVLVSENQDDTTYAPPGLLEFGRTYYWRVDDVNAPPEAAVNKGDVWSFTTVNFIVVDDFEDYNDYSPDDIFSTWTDGYDDDTNGAMVGYDEPDFGAGEHFVETTIIHGGDQSMPFFYDNNMKYSEAERPLVLGRDWTGDGVIELSLWFRGNPPYAGSFDEAPDGIYTVSGSGADIWAASDEFHFAFKQVTGAIAIIAKVESLENTDPFAKAGVMIRDTLEPGSRNVAVFITPENGVRFQYRNTAGGITERFLMEGITAPQWVKLERTAGGLVRGYYSEDGATWVRFDLIQIRMDMPAYVGLAVTSHNTALTCEAKFSNVSFPDTSVDSQWTDQDVGMVSNTAEPMYVALSNSTGPTAAVYHDDPNAAVINTWTEWIIPLQAFADQGVDLTDVDRIAIGFGTKGDTTKLGGSGAMYFDDIRLYRPPEPTP
ncbi:MAG TPA: LamG domain-containing protein [Sedimentisphaerales bacterium]|nr:LamG domain-containing protein [Sedimentisphaerales bacterium]